MFKTRKLTFKGEKKVGGFHFSTKIEKTNAPRNYCKSDFYVNSCDEYLRFASSMFSPRPVMNNCAFTAGELCDR